MVYSEEHTRIKIANYYSYFEKWMHLSFKFNHFKMHLFSCSHIIYYTTCLSDVTEAGATVIMVHDSIVLICM